VHSTQATEATVPILHPHAALLDLSTCKVACSSCSLRKICLPMGLSEDELALVDQHLVAQRRSVARGQVLFRKGARFDAVYAVWTGFFKTFVRAGRRDQVTGFQMGGELIGLDAIGSGRFQADAVALENSQVCVIPFEVLQWLAHDVQPLQAQLNRVMSSEIARKQALMLLLGGMPAELRVAAFLLDLAQRLRARGFSSSSLVLRMTRREIGSLLGLTLETVSRALSRLQLAGLLAVRTRHVQIADAHGLQRLVERAAA
jgi:CRP/FNR family transcriptional regulator, anaerobic regulatory protein